MLATGAAVGLVNGAVYVYGRMPHPFIITLATLSICKGLAYQLSHGQNITGVAPLIRFVGSYQIFGLPFSAFIVAAVALALYWLAAADLGTLDLRRRRQPRGGRRDRAFRRAPCWCRPM